MGERVTGLRWLAVFFSLAGLVLVLDPAHLGGSLESKLLAIASGMSWAASAVVVKRIRARGPTDVINLTAWQMLYGSIPIIIIAVLTTSRPIEWTGAFIAALAYNVIPATAIAWVLWLYVLQVLPTGVAGISTLATPVIGIVAAAVVLGRAGDPDGGGGDGLHHRGTAGAGDPGAARRRRRREGRSPSRWRPRNRGGHRLSPGRRR